MTISAKQYICPGVSVQLTIVDGNAVNVISSVLRAMRSNNVRQDVMDAFLVEAKSGDYVHLLQTCMKYVDIY